MHHSQFQEDEIIEEIFSIIGTTNKFYVEIGAHGDGKISNTLALKEKGWIGWWFDAEPQANIIQCHFTAENINKVLDIWCPQRFDFLSLDIDGNDYYIWEAMKTNPRVVCIEYNNKKQKGIQEYRPEYQWEGQEGFGSSKEDLLKLAEKKGYKFYKETEANLIFIWK